MIVGEVQRWRQRRGRYRPAGEPIDPRQWEVAELLDDTTPKTFVCEHHYSGTYPAALRRFGIYAKGGRLEGVAVLSMPAQAKVLNVLAGDKSTPRGELGRFVLADTVPANGESWFLAECFRRLRRDGWTGVVSHADPVPRPAADGTVVFGGHIGSAYQALNAIYTGRTKPRTLRLLPDATVVSPRALTKIRKRERGWRYATEQLVKHGAAPLLEDEDARAWVSRWIAALTRPLRHEGNLRYVWSFDERHRKSLKPKPYPKDISLPLL